VRKPLVTAATTDDAGKIPHPGFGFRVSGFKKRTRVMLGVGGVDVGLLQEVGFLRLDSQVLPMWVDGVALLRLLVCVRACVRA
jgi:hypothetical protein